MAPIPQSITLPALTPEEYRLLCECVRVANIGMDHVELAVALKQKLLAPQSPPAEGTIEPTPMPNRATRK